MFLMGIRVDWCIEGQRSRGKKIKQWQSLHRTQHAGCGQFFTKILKMHHFFFRIISHPCPSEAVPREEAEEEERESWLWRRGSPRWRWQKGWGIVRPLPIQVTRRQETTQTLTIILGNDSVIRYSMANSNSQHLGRSWRLLILHFTIVVQGCIPSHLSQHEFREKGCGLDQNSPPPREIWTVL